MISSYLQICRMCQEKRRVPFHSIVQAYDECFPIASLGLLFENRPALYFCYYKENEKNNTRMLDT